MLVEAAEDALDPASFTDGHTYAYAWLDEAAGILRARMFAPVLGIREDEATGAAAVAITTKLDRDLAIHQGLGSRIVTRRLPDGVVEIAGRIRRSSPLRWADERPPCAVPKQVRRVTGRRRVLGRQLARTTACGIRPADGRVRDRTVGGAADPGLG